MLGHGGDQVVALGAGELEEILGYYAAYRVESPIVPVGVAAAVPVPPGKRVGGASLQLLPKDVE